MVFSSLSFMAFVGRVGGEGFEGEAPGDGVRRQLLLEVVCGIEHKGSGLTTVSGRLDPMPWRG